jgi:hypothetical protein
MSAKKPLPKIAPCPSGCMRVEVIHFGGHGLYQVRSCCGWNGPVRASVRGAINAWNRRAKNEESDRQGKGAANRTAITSDGVPVAYYAKASKETP